MTINRPSCTIKSGDIFISASVIALAVISGVIIAAFFRSGSSDSVTVRTTDGVTNYSLSTDADYTIVSNSHTLMLSVRNGEAFVASADCPDHVCINTPAISEPGDVVICVPSRFIASIEVEDSEECDYVAG